jgi:hypothetical protein
MSSAILYLAIVAIWACVLIPRWLRRDSARGAAAPATLEPPVLAESELDDPNGARPGENGIAAYEDASFPVPGPLSAEESRRRMLPGRRRLLLMLIGLEIAALALAFIGLAAVWVILPPTIMLAGYLLLLREAAQADAERAQRDADAALRAREHARQRAQERTAARLGAPARGTPAENVSAAAAALLSKFASAPVPADYEDASPGRDFAPGLAGKYTTSNAEAEAADEDHYGGNPAPRLRAVGD